MMNTVKFYTFEELTEHLSDLTGFNPPRLLEGRKEFFGKFNQWLISDQNTNKSKSWICIYPDPSFSLSYPYPIDEISVASSLCKDGGEIPEKILSIFELNDTVSKQQTLSLHG